VSHPISEKFRVQYDEASLTSLHPISCQIKVLKYYASPAEPCQINLPQKYTVKND
jgi:hypothetical protein